MGQCTSIKKIYSRGHPEYIGYVAMPDLFFPVKRVYNVCGTNKGESQDNVHWFHGFCFTEVII